jgi:orotidine-5'-phosphate decarboxylase
MSHCNHFSDRLIDSIQQKKSCVVVGLDPQVDNLPPCLIKDIHRNDPLFLQKASNALLEFNLAIIESCAPYAVAFKPQIAFYECLGWEGLRALARTLEYIKGLGVLAIVDAKRNDIGHTAKAYAEAFLGTDKTPGQGNPPPFEADALTINPYLGSDGIEPFIRAAQANEKGLFVLVRTSNPSAHEVQDLSTASGPVCNVVGRLVHKWGQNSIGRNGYSFVNAVIGATYPDQARILRQLMPQSFFLVPGYGAQGATSADVMGCFHADGLGAIVNASRSIIYAYKHDPWNKKFSESEFAQAAAEAAKAMRDELRSGIGARGAS